MNRYRVAPSCSVRLCSVLFNFALLFWLKRAEREKIEAIEALDSEVSNFDFHGLPAPLPPSLQEENDAKSETTPNTTLTSIDVVSEPIHKHNQQQQQLLNPGDLNLFVYDFCIIV
ncbi:hypothetical protein PIB30_118920 [Stylosanthes scabra]|uniref:Uncharacterized protein n=1 Tax=Stylosanthes scabra TaxID=79078 RepID=A0ABU6V5J2_9FABA|nr:hypothetical protein [Stylosanthes scabra]